MGPIDILSWAVVFSLALFFIQLVWWVFTQLSIKRGILA